MGGLFEVLQRPDLRDYVTEESLGEEGSAIGDRGAVEGRVRSRGDQRGDFGPLRCLRPIGELARGRPRWRVREVEGLAPCDFGPAS